MPDSTVPGGPSTDARAPGVRWWPLPVILVIVSLRIAWIWLGPGDRTGQERVLPTILASLGATIALGVWLFLFSRLTRRARLNAGVLIAIVAVALSATVRIRGVTGDLVPILEWRWAGAPAPLMDSRPSESPAGAAEFPQFLGPHRDGRVPDSTLSRDWTNDPPRLVWKRAVGAGWSGFAVAGGLAITQEQRGEQEMVVAYELATGAVRWTHGDPARYHTTIAGEGPRATPTISRGRVFSLGSTGLLNALDLETGAPIWQRDIDRDNDAPSPDWGRSGSPLATDDLIVVSAGGTGGKSLVAYDRTNGTVVWQAGSDRAGYSSPVEATLAGVRQILIFNAASVAAHDPATGRVLWEFPWPALQANVAQPLILFGDRVLVSSGYGIGSKLLQVEADAAGRVAARLIWESPRLKAKFTNLVVHDGFVYGLDDGVLVCLDPADGQRRWKNGRYGHGQVLLAGAVLLVQTEEGELVLVEPRPDAHREIARFRVFDRKTWNAPALAGRFLLVRNDVEAAVYDVGGRR